MDTELQNDVMTSETAAEASETKAEISEPTEPAESAEAQSAEDTGEPENELDALRRQVKELRSALLKRQTELERVGAQIEEFSSLFPETAMEAVPEEVWASVRSGNSLAAAYALYQRRVQLREEHIKTVSGKNAYRSTGQAGRGTASEYYTPDEVRSMSAGEVRANYSKIIESMKKWN